MRTNLLFLTLAIISFLLACSEADESVNPTLVTSLLGEADPSLNEFLLVAVGEEVYTLDPNTGISRRILFFDDFNDIESLPEYHNGVLYCVTQDNGLTAFNVETNEVLWQTGIPDYYFSSISKMSPIYANNTIYVAGLRGIMTATDATTGRIRWEYTFQIEPDDPFDNMYGRVSLHDNALVHGTSGSIDDNYLHKIDATNGSRIWRVPLAEEGLTGSTAIADDIIYVPTENFEARNFATGELLWQQLLNDFDGASTPVVAGDKVLFQGGSGSVESSLYCLDRRSGEVLWTVDTGLGDAAQISPAVAGNVVFGVYERGTIVAVGGINGRPFAVSLETGELLWENDRISVDTSPVYANGRLYFDGQNFDIDDFDSSVGIICLDAATGEFLWVNTDSQFNRPFPPIVVAQNGVFKRGGW
ncbi:outer membrane protein assembly factor BamB family protein [Tunicatimonas pelagia]|uniref:outer membrane protein assembly factor BamB family protein n=1 Tax=Tunicatimonas pelagia TaxID=931531 RepID=UPI0026668914|nr:PQQ-binding-like beta-propeller repeat protein [Tunicatimonas pelagia]WKN41020.1 PQQ-binding-like beta-propeller repeat protein [Tunicatimonas pelagia]